MSRDLAHKKRVQAGFSLTAAGLGLGALATKGGGAGARQLLRRAPKVATRMRLRPHVPDVLDRTSLGLVTTGAGVGGISGINFAALQRAEAKKEDPRVIKSAFGVVMKYSDEPIPDAHRRLFVKREREQPYLGGAADAKNFSELGRAVPQRPVKVANAPIVPRRTRPGGIDEEDRRQRRMSAEQYGMAGAAVPTAVVGGTMAVRSARNAPAKRKLIAQAARNTTRAAQYEGVVAAAGPREKRHLTNAKSATTRAATERAKNVKGASLIEESKKKAARQEGYALKHARHAAQVALTNKHAASTATSLHSAATVALSDAAKLKVRPKAAAATLGTAAALGGGALAVRRMRRHQGKQYSDWWDD